jgi:glycerophosphoryl diester phosphodiesterase
LLLLLLLLPALAGAQFIECCDIVLTADLVPICRHEPLISGTTNANEVFPDRVSILDGVLVLVLCVQW